MNSVINVNKDDLTKMFCTLAEIPSPSLKEDKVIDWILNYCKENNLQCETDNYRNIYIKVAPTDTSKKPILLSAHMDVVGDDSPVVTYIDSKEGVIRAKGRTLGADDKAGITNALYFATKLNKVTDMAHGGLEIVFTRDEENGMTGIKNVDFSKLQSKDVLVLDADYIGQCLSAGASYVGVKLSVVAPKGGHSGNDVGDQTRENATKLIADLVSEMPHGVFKADKETGDVICSCNLGGIQSGDLNVTNVINTHAQATYSIRSSSEEAEQDLINSMKFHVDAFNAEYKDIATAEISFTVKMPKFVNNDGSRIIEAFKVAAKNSDIEPKIGSFHAGAETHIYAQKQNANGENFCPLLLGLATVCNMHSAGEYLDYNSMVSGQKLLQNLFFELNK